MLKREAEQRQAIEFYCIDMLVPEDHLLRKIDKAVDFRHIYDIVEELYCEDNGRPSADPVVLFKMVLIQHLYGIRSLRQTWQDVNLNLGYRWFLGYTASQPLPHFATISYAFRHRFTASFDDLPTTEGGYPVEYYVVEESVSTKAKSVAVKYARSGDAWVLTNTPEYTPLGITKKWSDGNGDVEWPRDANGHKAIDLAFGADLVTDGTSANDTRAAFTLKGVTPTDENGRSARVSVNGTSYRITYTCLGNAADGNAIEIKGLPFRTDGGAWDYHAAESGHVSGYAVSYENPARDSVTDCVYDGGTITNGPGAAERDFTFEKVWKDEDGAVIDWEKAIAVTLHRQSGEPAERDDDFAPSYRIGFSDGEFEITTESGYGIDAAADDGYRFRIKNLEIVDENGAEYAYYITEEAVPGCATTYSDGSPAADGAPDAGTITNTDDPNQTRSYTVKKEWSDGLDHDGDSVVVQLYVQFVFNKNDENGWLKQSQVENVEFLYSYGSDAPDKPYAAWNLNALKRDCPSRQVNVLVKVTLKEEAPAQSTRIIPQASGTTVPANVAPIYDRKNTAYVVTQNKANNWTWVTPELPMVDEDGNTYRYYIKEEIVNTTLGDAVSATYAYSGFDITISNAVETDSTDFEFTKIWYNGDGQEVEWQGGIDITLYAAGEGVEESVAAAFTLDENGGTVGDYTFAGEAVTGEGVHRTKFTISGLPAKNDSGTALSYYVRETRAEGCAEPTYATSTGTLPQADRAEDGQYIQNRPLDSYTLPSTGGPGTALYTATGGLLTLLAAALLLARKRHD